MAATASALGWLELDWLYSKADATRDEPNTRYYEYERLPQTGAYQFARGSFSNDHRVGRTKTTTASWH